MSGQKTTIHNPGSGPGQKVGRFPSVSKIYFALMSPVIIKVAGSLLGFLLVPQERDFFYDYCYFWDTKSVRYFCLLRRD